ncbi:MAG: S-adenosylmethionine:tRNA ribosyltransferase-isomerase [Flavobacteriales bacterium]
MEILDYTLAPEKIAFKPKNKRSDSKLLFYNSGQIRDYEFSQITNIISQEYDLVLNETKVVNARIFFQKPTGGIIEVFCLEPATGDVTERLAQAESVLWRCMIGGAKKWKEGVISVSSLKSDETEPLVLSAERIQDEDGTYILKFSWSKKGLTFSEILDEFGKIPLPPYIKRKPEEEDLKRYQTVFATNEGSVAAPTASLHFTTDILNELQKNGVDNARVNLHVGAGTFKPISSSVEEHEMHHELFEVDLVELRKLAKSEKLIAVGTTAVRTLESLFILANSLAISQIKDLNSPQIVKQWEWKSQKITLFTHKEALKYLASLLEAQGLEKVHGYTSLMIVPGFKFKVIKGLITNFHMPKSTLLFLVSALVGENWKAIYAHALNNDYHFLSYGDSSLLMP